MNKGTVRSTEQKIVDTGFNIKEIRLKRSLSQAYVAKQCGVSCTTVQNWENGTCKSIKKEHFEKLKEVLDN